MTSNLPDDLKVNWLDNDIVMPLDVNTWSSAINVIKKVIPSYSANGNFYTATFSNNVYSLTPITTDSKQNNTPTAYIDGMTVIFKCPTTNTNSCSVNVNGLGNKQIKNLNGSNIASGGIIAGNYIELVYDVSQGYFRYTDSELTKHINNTSNPHNVTKAQVGLGNCDNTSDANKPISTATQNALNNKADVNLNNLSTTGQAKLNNKANVDLSNLSTAGQTIIDNKSNVDLSNLSDEGQAIIDNKANVDLSNLNANQTAKDTITTWGMPNYSKGISVKLPYTVTSSGFMFIQVSGYDWWHFATVNDKRIGASVGYSGGKEVGNGVVFPVSEGDVVSSSNAGGAYFYPMKGADE